MLLKRKRKKKTRKLPVIQRSMRRTGQESFQRNGKLHGQVKTIPDRCIMRVTHPNGESLSKLSVQPCMVTVCPIDLINRVYRHAQATVSLQVCHENNK